VEWSGVSGVTERIVSEREEEREETGER
jgi:hypothetical protein